MIRVAMDTETEERELLTFFHDESLDKTYIKKGRDEETLKTEKC